NFTDVLLRVRDQFFETSCHVGSVVSVTEKSSSYIPRPWKFIHRFRRFSQIHSSASIRVICVIRVSCFLLLVAQRLDRIEPGRFSRRIKSEENSNGCAHEKGDDN